MVKRLIFLCEIISILFIGGVRRAVGVNISVKFDASHSMDPDSVAGEGAIKYKWFCRRENEVDFPGNYMWMTPSDSTAGCYKNGKWLLSQSYANFNETRQGAVIFVSI